MATRKQKHQAALAKREKFMEQYKADGLAAQRRAHDNHQRRIEEIEARNDMNDHLMWNGSLLDILTSLNPENED